jgi:hypothetical protein
MAELGQIHPEKHLACPHCSSLLGEETVALIVEGGDACCPSCGQAVKLPERVIEGMRQSRYKGKNLDITC